jgi:hypothetical protein
MNEQDRKLAEALLAEDTDLLREGGRGESIFGDVFGMFRGKRGLLNAFGVFWAAVFAALMIWAGYMFFTTDGTDARLTWGLLAIVGLVVNGLVKIWAWMEIHRVGTQRELRRIELRLAVIDDRLRGDAAA